YGKEERVGVEVTYERGILGILRDDEVGGEGEEVLEG
ncbi:hypothetical protein A2U01_0017882, partial [Trifolium medium]|nr:hypothetical protein [Trifolium medium]